MLYNTLHESISFFDFIEMDVDGQMEYERITWGKLKDYMGLHGITWDYYMCEELWGYNLNQQESNGIDWIQLTYIDIN